MRRKISSPTKFVVAFLVFASLFVGLTNYANAQTAVPVPPSTTCTTSAGTGINTAIGCIPINDENSFITFLVRWSIGVGGGIAFLLILYASFLILTSAGIPERVKSGRDLLTAAISGLILIIFSIFVLRLIGVEVLKIPGFGN